MKRIDSSALIAANRAIGLTGAGSPQTELHDGEVFQVLGIGDIARRGLSVAASQGIFTGVMRNEHTDAESLFSRIFPYDVNETTVNNLNGYPAVIPAGFDVWLLSIAAIKVSGTGTIFASFHVGYGGQAQGFGLDDSDVAEADSGAIPVFAWDSVGTFGGNNILQNEQGIVRWFGPLRIANTPAAQFQFWTTSSATSIYQAQITVGLFPAALGQDAI